jgi:hypothetical protein
VDVPIVEFKGRNGRLALYETFVRIDRGTAMGFLMQGLKGQKDIYFDSITSIQVKKPGLSVGFIQFSVPGGIESRKGVTTALADENTVGFGDMESYEKALKVKEYVENHRSKATQASVRTSRVEELEKLVALRQQGALTDEEFESMKKQIIGR